MSYFEDESFLRRVDATAEKYRDALLVAELSKKQKGIVDGFLKMNEDDHDRFFRLGAVIEDGHLQIATRATVHGVEEVLLFIDHAIDDEGFYGPKTGIKTPTMLDVSLYTD